MRQAEDSEVDEYCRDFPIVPGHTIFTLIYLCSCLNTFEVIYMPVAQWDYLDAVESLLKDPPEHVHSIIYVYNHSNSCAMNMSALLGLGYLGVGP
jgi:hypothetical protein